MFLINDLVLLCTVHCVPVAFLCSSVTGQHNIMFMSVLCMNKTQCINAWAPAGMGRGGICTLLEIM